MKKILFIVVGLLFLLAINCAAGESQPMLAGDSKTTYMGIVTSSSKSAYYNIGQDIASLVSRYGINLNVMPSNGSLDNVRDVFERPNVQLGIVQSDVLSFINTLGDVQLKKIARKVQMVFPLYKEEVHLLATRSINSLSDLHGKNVAIGKFGSGTYLTSKLIFKIADVEPRVVNIGGAEALKQLADGQVDAMFFVAGYPVKLFQEFQDDKFHLVPITDKGVMEYYDPSIIPANTYPWQDSAVNTVAVKAVLITYDYKSTDCKNVVHLAKIIYYNKAWLRRNGHSKWKEVFDLYFPLKKWKQSQCVEQALDLGKRRWVSYIAKLWPGMMNVPVVIPSSDVEFVMKQMEIERKIARKIARACKTQHLSHNGLFTRKSKAFGTKPTVNLKKLIKDGVMIEQENIRFDDFVAMNTEGIPLPKSGNALAINYGIAAIPEYQQRIKYKKCAAGNATHYLEIALKTADIAPAGHTKAPPVNYLFVVDVSGSMSGEKIETVKIAIQELFKQLKADDVIGVIAFNDQAKTLLELTPKQKLSSTKFGQIVANLSANGSTNIDIALSISIEEMRRHRNAQRVNQIFLLIITLLGEEVFGVIMHK